MGKPRGKKRAADADKSRFHQHKKSYHKYKKLLRKEGLANPPRFGRRAISSRVDDEKVEGGDVSKATQGTNRILQTFQKSKGKKESKESRIAAQEERNKIRVEKLKLKKQKNKRLNKWTKKGQPVMKNRMEVMLDKIISDKDTYC